MAAVATDPRLPVELILKVMDNVDISDLVRLSHVCLAWRRAAHAHPIFWRDIKLVVLKSPPLDLFQARLNAHTSPIDLDVVWLSHVRDDEYNRRQFRSVVVPAVHHHLPRIKHLRVGCTDNLCSYICEGLLQPAPMLQDLHLTNFPKDYIVPSLPENFLGGYAPRLKEAFLNYVALPGPTHAVTAFRNIETLHLKFDGEFAVSDMLAHFPALKNLRVSVSACIAADARMGFADRTLTTLDVVVWNETYTPFFSAFHPLDLAAIRHLTCSASGARPWIHTLLSVLKGPLTLTIRDHGLIDVSVELSSADSAQARTRTFHIDQSHGQGQEVVLWLFRAELLTRISHFRLLSKNASIVPEIGDALPACETVELCFDGSAGRSHPLIRRLNYNALREPYALQFPAVRTIICIPSDDAPVGLAVSADDLSALLARVIQDRPSPLEFIELAGVQLTGDIQALEREYGCTVRQQKL